MATGGSQKMSINPAHSPAGQWSPPSCAKIRNQVGGVVCGTQKARAAREPYQGLDCRVVMLYA